MIPPGSPLADKASGAKSAKLWLPILGIAAALLLFGLFHVYPGDSSGILYLLFVLPFFLVISVIMLIWVVFPRNRRHWTAVLLTLIAFWAISIPLAWYEFRHPFEIRGIVRWFVESRELKQQVLKFGRGRNGELYSIDWDGWGMFAQNTEIYLVFDPTDSLAEAARKHESGRFPGIPCAVQGVRRLENHWYSVVFFTSETWGDCD